MLYRSVVTGYHHTFPEYGKCIAAASAGHSGDLTQNTTAALRPSPSANQSFRISVNYIVLRILMHQNITLSGFILQTFILSTLWNGLPN